LKEKYPGEDIPSMIQNLYSTYFYSNIFSHPVEIGVIDEADFEMNPKAKPAFNLLTDIVLKIVDGSKFDESQSGHQILNQYLQNLPNSSKYLSAKMTDLEEVKNYKQVIEASARPPPPSQKYVELTEKSLKQYLGQKELSQNMNKEIFRKKLLRYLKEFRNWDDWQKKQIKDGIEVWTRGNLSTTKFMTKVECKVKCNIEKAFKAYVEWSTTDELMVDLQILERTSLGDNQENLDMYFYAKFPFPFAARDFVFSLWSHFTPTYATILLGSVERVDRPPVKGKVRAKCLSITILETDTDDPNYTKLLIFGQNDYRVKMPHWVASQVWRTYYFIIQKMRDMMQK